jgi:hypothetical protein
MGGSVSEVVYVPDEAWVAVYEVIDDVEVVIPENEAKAVVVAAAPHITRQAQMEVLREMVKGPVDGEQWTLGLIVGRISTRLLELEGWERM